MNKYNFKYDYKRKTVLIPAIAVCHGRIKERFLKNLTLDLSAPSKITNLRVLRSRVLLLLKLRTRMKLRCTYTFRDEERFHSHNDIDTSRS